MGQPHPDIRVEPPPGSSGPRCATAADMRSRSSGSATTAEGDQPHESAHAIPLDFSPGTVARAAREYTAALRHNHHVPKPESSPAAPIRVLWLVKGLGPGGAEQLLVSSARVADHTRFHYSVAFVRPDKTHLVPALESAGVPAQLLLEGVWAASGGRGSCGR